MVFPPKEFDTAPIVLLSIHGRYNSLSKYTLPPNTWIFETTDVGDVCLSTIDQPLWQFVQGENRDKFLAYLKDEGNDENEEMRDTFKEVISQLNYYEPGDMIYEREFIFSKEDKDMNFYLFPVGKKFHNPVKGSAILPELRKHIIDTEEMQSTSTIIEEARKKHRELKNGAIFIISSCGAITPTNYKHFGTEIEKHQRAQILKFKEYTTAASLDAVSAKLPPVSRKSRSLRRPKETVLPSEEKRNPSKELSRAEPGLTMNEDSPPLQSRKGGFVRQKTRKIRKLTNLCPCSPDVGDCPRCSKNCIKHRRKIARTQKNK